MSKPSKKGKAVRKPTYRIPPDSPWAGAWKIAAVLAVLGGAACALGAMNDAHRFAFSWLFALITFLAFGLGGLFFVLGQHLSGASWGITSRRTAEMLMIGLCVFPVLFIPIGLNLGELYSWTQHHGEAAEHGEGESEGHEGEEHEGEGEADDGHGHEHGALGFRASSARAQDLPEPRDYHPDARDAVLELADELGGGAAAAEEHAEEGEHHDPEHAQHSEILEAKGAYLNVTFFVIRAVIYMLAWIALALLFFRWSTQQDKKKGLSHTKTMQRWAPLSTFVFGFSLTFALFDWVMSLEPSWYSTIFGVQFFAVSSLVGYAAVILLTMGLRQSGVLGEAVNVEHYHDLGKMMFGFIVFWAYISFSQFMLIWYAGIPEEATYYHLRWWGGGGFQNLSIIVLFGHFFVPFLALMSRNVKRRLSLLGFGAAWMLVMHVLEMYLVVMPYADQTGLVTTSMRLHWMDLAALFAVGGTYFGFVLYMMTRWPMIPVGDPRLSRSLHFQNA